MASSSSSPSVTAFSSQSWKYDVFLSFRGVDTRRNFVDHFYSALAQRGILTYKDDLTLPRGESISPSLVKAIEETAIAVIIFSKNYADSRWCLDELVHIMRCKDTRGQIVMPIFYDVDPSEVRKQNGKYGQTFAKHKVGNNMTKVESWRKALVDASNLSGWVPKNMADGNEAVAIKEIINTITWKLGPLPSQRASEDLIGMAVRVKDLISKLQFGSGGVRMIGIWGVGGGGKTALASSIYYEISSKFDGHCCFVENILEESRNYGLVKLQEKIVSGVLSKKQVQVQSVEEGRRVIKDSLHQRKVLIVLDDIDKLNQLEELAGSRDWFGEGSLVIITTRDQNLLTAHRVDVIHNISLLNDDEAKELFRKNAYPIYGHMEADERRLKDLVSSDVVSYAGGLPLALKVLGQFLFYKDINQWRSAFARLIQMPDRKTHIHYLVAADTKNRRLIDLNIERRVQDTRPLPEDFSLRLQLQHEYRKADLVDAIIKPLFPDEDLMVLDQDVAHLKIPFPILNVATKNFSDEHYLARGGFGKVYRAQYKGGIVAIKRLDRRYGQGNAQFMMEIGLLSAYKHENLVSLVGYCDEGGEKILVYKFESNGSLDRHLHRKDLRWTQRIQICLDVARGLKFLHDDIGSHQRILHRDMKSANILLDKNFRAKISDFGFSKLAFANVPYTIVISNVFGTPGYVDPDYQKNGELTQKSDVYSFGVVMFEVLSGKMGYILKNVDEPSLAEKAQSHYEKETLDEMINPDLRNQMNLDSLSTFAAVAYRCLKCPAKERPRMVEVVKELEKALDYQEVVSPNKASS